MSTFPVTDGSTGKDSHWWSLIIRWGIRFQAFRLLGDKAWEGALGLHRGKGVGCLTSTMLGLSGMIKLYDWISPSRWYPISDMLNDVATCYGEFPRLGRKHNFNETVAGVINWSRLCWILINLARCKAKRQWINEGYIERRRIRPMTMQDACDIDRLEELDYSLQLHSWKLTIDLAIICYRLFYPNQESNLAQAFGILCSSLLRFQLGQDDVSPRSGHAWTPPASPSTSRQQSRYWDRTQEYPPTHPVDQAYSTVTQQKPSQQNHPLHLTFQITQERQNLSRAQANGLQLPTLPSSSDTIQQDHTNIPTQDEHRRDPAIQGHVTRRSSHTPPFLVNIREEVREQLALGHSEIGTGYMLSHVESLIRKARDTPTLDRTDIQKVLSESPTRLGLVDRAYSAYNRVYVDACPRGIGFVFGTQWQAWRLEPGWIQVEEARAIDPAEAIAVELALLLMIKAGYSRRTIAMRSDSLRVVKAIYNRSTVNLQIGVTVGRILDLCRDHEIKLKISWIPGEINPADQPSRLRINDDNQRFQFGIDIPEHLQHCVQPY